MRRKLFTLAAGGPGVMCLCDRGDVGPELFRRLPVVVGAAERFARRRGQVRIRLPNGGRPKSLKWLVSGAGDAARSEDGWVEFNLKSVLDHEVAVLAL